jgi:hypothetical protein
LSNQCCNNIVRIEFCTQIIKLSGMKQGLCLPYCVSRTPLRVRQAMCVMCNAAWDWLWVTWKDSCCVYELVEGVSFTDLLLCNQYVYGILAYIMLPNSSRVCLFDMSSVVVKYLILFHIHVCFVKCVMHRQIMDCWFLYILYVLCVLHL